jgi:hypothetical protein
LLLFRRIILIFTKIDEQARDSPSIHVIYLIDHSPRAQGLSHRDRSHVSTPEPSWRSNSHTPNISGRSTPQVASGQRFADDLEGQNDEALEGLTGKVKILKEVCLFVLLALSWRISICLTSPQLSLGIGQEVRESAIQLAHMVSRGACIATDIGSLMLSSHAERRVHRDWRDTVGHISENEYDGQATRRSVGMLHDISDNCFLDIRFCVVISINYITNPPYGLGPSKFSI